MKHLSGRLSDELQSLTKFVGRNQSSGTLVKGLHPSAMALLPDIVPGLLLFVSPREILNSFREYFHPNWENNQGLYFPQKESVSDAPGGFISVGARERELCKSVIESFSDDIRFIITTRDGAAEPFFSNQKNTVFKLNRSCEFDLLIEWLVDNHYDHTDLVCNPGSYSIRGGVIDVFPLADNYPVRVNFTSDEIELYRFDVDTQMTTDKLSECSLAPLSTTEGNSSILDLFGNTVLSVEIFDNGDVIFGNRQEILPVYTFPLQPLSMEIFFSRYQKNPQITYQVDSRLTRSGFSTAGPEFITYIIPDWLNKKIADSADKNMDIRIPSIDFNGIEYGDYLVHNDYGVCRYLGLKSVDSTSTEYVLLEFDDNSLISLSTSKLRKLSFYASGHQMGITPDSLTKTAKWNRQKQSARRLADEIVEELLMSYAERSSVTRSGLSFDTEIENLFISRFQFTDTPDQRKAWNEISTDLSQKNKPMNRLLCGDVGFGKTEIAVRAAFRVVFNGKQVAVLAPTTILVNQLYTAFHDRLSEFGVSVDVVSRFRTKSEIKSIFDRVESGSLDVIIGTHALLSDKLQFSSLGLLIVDEEQRFGVNQKEKIQTIQNNIDVLSMSATPIPRTLHIAISGIRDISTLVSPPKSRYPIHTQISYYDHNTIRETILFEVSRGGQVFFIHNEVKGIEDFVRILSDMFPYLTVRGAHGQEPSKTLENTIAGFLQKKIDILVCSTIIETGIDIPNANTIIINKAHRFGLSQLHQIRGRVGRGTRQAYALLLIPKGFILKRDAYRRLKTIEKHTRLGEGYNISVMDLEIRGAGSLFGYRQSGNAARIGVELYTQFINDAIQRTLNKTREKKLLDISTVTVNLFKDSSIPISYINPTNIRLDFYRKLSQANTVKDVLKLEYELENRFGRLPLELTHLVLETKLRIRACLLGITAISTERYSVSLEFDGIFIGTKIQILLETVFQYFNSLNIPFRYVERKRGKLNLSITVASVEDIPTILMNFFDKLDDLFLT